MALPAQARRSLARQRAVARATGFVWIPLVAGLLRWGSRYRIEGVAEVRRAYRELWRESDAPLLVCANHLTMIDSALISWALGSPWWYLRHFRALPWNVPDQASFASNWRNRTLVYLMKCLPMPRGGRRQDVAAVVQGFAHLIGSGEVGLVFPEGGRSRTARVELDSAAAGVGRVFNAVSGCRVLCVYLRGAQQERYTALPVRGERFHVSIARVEPKTEASGLRASLEVSRQIVACLIELEARCFDGWR